MSSAPSPRIVYITSGAGGMICGSCLHDNTLARALTEIGIDAALIPTYTPIRTDEQDVSIDRVFFGGINVYLQQKIPLFRHLPAVVDRFLDNRRLLRWATSRGMETSAKELGALTVSMLRGASGYQRKEIRKLCDYLAGHHRPDLVNLSNMLIAGCVPQLKERLGIPVLATLQGDDIFLEDLIEPYKSQALDLLRELVQHVDAFLVFSNYYADYMSDYLSIARHKFRLVPLGIDTRDFLGPADEQPERPPTVGYLARLAPEKGLQVLVDAFVRLKQRRGMEGARLHVAGWMADNRKAWAEQLFDQIRQAGHGESFYYAGTVDRSEKLQFLSQLDVLSVPTVYREPKGLFVLEALATGVPVVQPEHGAFPELIAALGGGRLFRPQDPEHLAEVLHEMLFDRAASRQLGLQARELVHREYHARAMATRTMEVYREFL